MYKAVNKSLDCCLLGKVIKLGWDTYMVLIFHWWLTGIYSFTHILCYLYIGESTMNNIYIKCSMIIGLNMWLIGLSLLICAQYGMVDGG